MPDTFIKIASVTVGAGGASAITFSSIPSTYTDLVVKLSARGDTGNFPTVFWYLNSDFGTSNTWRSLSGNGASASSSTTSAYAVQSAGIAPASSQTSNTYLNSEIYLANYAGSTNKSFSIDAVGENNATTAYAVMNAGIWTNTAAINRLDFYVSGANFVQYSTAVLYGIKNS